MVGSIPDMSSAVHVNMSALLTSTQSMLSASSLVHDVPILVLCFLSRRGIGHVSLPGSSLTS